LQVRKYCKEEIKTDEFQFIDSTSEYAHLDCPKKPVERMRLRPDDVKE
jgi:hypothetical protein